MIKHLNTVNIILSIVIIVLLIICIVNSTEYFVNILPCNCNTNPSCSPECPNYVSPYAPLSIMSN